MLIGSLVGCKFNCHDTLHWVNSGFRPVRIVLPIHNIQFLFAFLNEFLIAGKVNIKVFQRIGWVVDPGLSSAKKAIQFQIPFRQFFFCGFGKIFNSGFGFEGLGAGADFLLEHECQRAAGAQVLRSLLAPFDMLGEAPVDVGRNAGVQTASLHANYVQIPVAHWLSFLRDLCVSISPPLEGGESFYFHRPFAIMKRSLLIRDKFIYRWTDAGGSRG